MFAKTCIFGIIIVQTIHIRKVKIHNTSYINSQQNIPFAEFSLDSSGVSYFMLVTVSGPFDFSLLSVL